MPDSIHTNPDNTYDIVATEATSYTYLALGDSYTIGESVPEKDRWSIQLTAMLKEEGIKILPPDTIAKTGWTTSELSDAIANSGNTNTYSIVSLLIGVNNQYRGQNIETYKNEFRALLNTSITFANGNKTNVFVLSIPDWGVTPYAKDSDQAQISNQIDAFNDAAKKEAEQIGILFVDITKLSRLAKNRMEYVAKDNLHFSGKMYKLWAEKALPSVRLMLQ